LQVKGLEGLEGLEMGCVGDVFLRELIEIEDLYLYYYYYY